MYRGKVKTADSSNIVKEAVVVGDVSVGENSTVLFHAVLRGDAEKIVIGNFSNIQDNCTVHADRGFPTTVGDYVTVGHNAVIHGCTIGDGSLIGMGAVVLNGAKIGKECLIGAGSVVLERQEIPDGSLAVGNPARVVRTLSETEREKLYKNSREYVKVGKDLRAEGYCGQK
ncbi:gamma carbonic anhydrase family protein [Mediterraneibacter glycyrrhizinilyticus]|uniref:gamma carbonic anhydrase family protein n=1 Tax=Mediterraneibacter glycyrrhizinilyticus TaxID=342942 RepID=UPI00196136F6|nr:gamma carbonic anhydrase family protein [Mediterraneibacter glycyrrhizinilyticus]MBM6752162.1 gamma carbonic anhydrase family protein [Mediterraneibacter glycyrrhizinilyticus]